MKGIIRRPSPALVVAMIVLFAALGGFATAATVAPLAKRALMADNAKKLGGQSAAQLLQAANAKAGQLAQEAGAAAASLPGPASSAAGLVTVKTTPWTIAADQVGTVTSSCDAGQKAIAGGFDNQAGLGLPIDTHPTPGGEGWQTTILVLSDVAASGSAYAVCLR